MICRIYRCLQLITQPIVNLELSWIHRICFLLTYFSICFIILASFRSSAFGLTFLSFESFGCHDVAAPLRYSSWNRGSHRANQCVDINKAWDTKMKFEFQWWNSISQGCLFFSFHVTEFFGNIEVSLLRSAISNQSHELHFIWRPKVSTEIPWHKEFQLLDFCSACEIYDSQATLGSR